MVAEFNINEIIDKFIIFQQLLEKELVNDKIVKDKFYSIIPDYLKTDAKKKFLTNIKKDVITKKDIVNFLKKQTMGKEFMNFDILLEYLNIKTNDYDFPIFNDKLKFAEIKKEALYIWWILNILKNNVFIKKYWYMIKGELQKSLDSEIAGNNSKKYDLFLYHIGVIVEIDEENHGNYTLTNDTLKDSLARMNGTALVRLYTKDICSLNSKKEYSENKQNMAEFRDILINVVMGSLMRFEEIRKDRLKDMFEDDIIADINDIKVKLVEKTAILNTLDPTSDSEKYNYQKKRKDGLLDSFDRKRTLLRDFKGDLSMKLFEIKRRTEKSKDKIIDFKEIYEIFGIKKDDLDKKQILYEFIEDSGLFDDKDCISWENLSFIIYQLDNIKIIKKINKDILAEYYRKVEKNYEIIIKEIMFYYEHCVPKIENYENYIDHVENYLYDKLKKENDNLKQENHIIKIERDNYKNKFEFYDKRKSYIMLEQLYHEGKSNYCMVLLSKLECIRYDFFSEYTKDDKFEEELACLTQSIKSFINTYDKYYNSYIRQPKIYKSRFDREAILKETGEYIKNMRKKFASDVSASEDNSSCEDDTSEKDKLYNEDSDELD